MDPSVIEIHFFTGATLTQSCHEYYDKALEVLEQGYKIADNMLEENNPLTAQCLMYIGILMLEQAKEKKALEGTGSKILSPKFLRQ